MLNSKPVYTRIHSVNMYKVDRSWTSANIKIIENIFQCFTLMLIDVT